MIEDYLSEMEQVIRSISRADIQALAEVLLANWRVRGQVFIVGNGGSAATASHLMNDLNKSASVVGKHRLRCIALTDSVPLLTAIGNDLSYAEIFVELLKNLCQAGDVLIVISTSGNSPNVVQAIRYAREHGIIVLGLCGKDGGELFRLSDRSVRIPAARIGQQEDGHMIVGHILTEKIRELISLEPQI